MVSLVFTVSLFLTVSVVCEQLWDVCAYFHFARMNARKRDMNKASLRCVFFCVSYKLKNRQNYQNILCKGKAFPRYECVNESLNLIFGRMSSGNRDIYSVHFFYSRDGEDVLDIWFCCRILSHIRGIWLT